MDRNTAVSLAQAAIKAQNKRLVEAILEIKSEREKLPAALKATKELPLIAVTCATGWECYAIVDELVKTRQFRVRALYRTPGTQAAKRLEALLETTEETHPGLLTLRSKVDMNSKAQLEEAFAGCHGVVLYVTANTSSAGKINNHGNDPVGGRAAVMRQVMANADAIKANPSVRHVVTLVFPRDKVTGIADKAPPCPWWIEQRLKISDFLRGQGINVTCIHRPAYYFAMHRVDYTSQEEAFRGTTSMSRTLIKENNVPGIMPADFLVNWVDVRDIGKWVGTVFDYPEVFVNVDFSIASAALTGNERVEAIRKINQHGTSFKYAPFPRWLMRILSLFTKEVIYPLRYNQWYTNEGNAFDFASEADLADLDRIHPRWTFEKKLLSWGIDQIKPKR